MPFIDVSKVGYDSVLANMAMLIVVFAGLSLPLDRWLGRHKSERAASASRTASAAVDLANHLL